VLITGASQGIGASIVRLFSDSGALVGLHYHQSMERATQIQREVEAAGGRIAVFAGDLRDSDFTKSLVDSFVERFGGIDVLVNNAGACHGYAHFSELDAQSWDHTFALNTKAPFFLTGRAFVFMQKGGGGNIINISSASVRYGSGSKGLHYTASKAALDSLTLGFSKAGAAHKIRVNSIRCGVIDTEMHTRIEGYSKEQYRERISLIPLQRVGTPLDVARMALFLASESGDFITGEVFTVAGGD